MSNNYVTAGEVLIQRRKLLERSAKLLMGGKFPVADGVELAAEIHEHLGIEAEEGDPRLCPACERLAEPQEHRNGKTKYLCMRPETCNYEDHWWVREDVEKSAEPAFLPNCDDPNCHGVIVSYSDKYGLQVEKCDDCARFDNDHEALEWLGANLSNMVLRKHREAR